MRRHLLCSLIAGLALATAGASQAEISDGVVRVGVLTDMSGVGFDVSGRGSVIAANMAAEDYVKQTGSRLKVEIISADHQNKADVGSSMARKWYDVTGVDAIVDLATSSVALAVSDVTKASNKTVLIVSAGSPDLTGKRCSPNLVHWLYDTWEQANSTGSAIVRNGGDSWFFITADYAFGHALEHDTSKVVKDSGGKILGQARLPQGSTDFSSPLLLAQSSKAKIVGLANAGTDFINSVKQAHEFGIVAGGQKLAGLLVFISDIHGLGLDVTQGLQVTETFYWDTNDQTRDWSSRFAKLHDGKRPTSVHAGVYASILHYLKAVDALQDDSDGVKVVNKMKAMPTDDPLFGKGQIRVDGRKIHPVYLFEVKSPGESKGPYDYYKLLQTVPADQAFRPLNEGGCPLVTEK